MHATLSSKGVQRRGKFNKHLFILFYFILGSVYVEGSSRHGDLMHMVIVLALDSGSRDPGLRPVRETALCSWARNFN